MELTLLTAASLATIALAAPIAPADVTLLAGTQVATPTFKRDLITLVKDTRVAVPTSKPYLDTRITLVKRMTTASSPTTVAPSSPSQNMWDDGREISWMPPYLAGSDEEEGDD